ncbi:DUF420 domain-containing protein [bacterium (Candidatus Blackallbacteria) CG17_big_fil_post_rev_8_21_14_2_50_48_46]|uniref:DUF420 domain-containing protein n=1 Tax=bacterium (Candidatus Blackallbacteria) CG17_big_fil_post_rev_8_21_14_2_50_48_46 TaxID=2014261 RepID=A0A2M7G3L1_9BACT|nr:MAG: hypothetical protein COW64_03390 [bacterium (Candidatus Blackallbacteria) CG18_big_fil_WC_8_21_14_2_50_49_26]PIW16460.1 MAG: DUF420 domain-containing protein [bacterium (Candidatus Blackallbacteria) CG17_big_fil_post_rev_8_21_14_2_50_48_46]PIW45968.1 MAG: DUF420 domain-containing protein [bacterium (Candidatus Blackallbacteria) CG13_big_fil_rev_8_21_14_2_50_49_14]
MQTTLDARFDRKVAIPAILGVSAVAIAFLFWLIYFRQAQTSQATWVNGLPGLNAFFNGTSATLILLGYQAIKRKQPLVHMRYMLGAFTSSSLFLVSYIVYHSLHGDTKFLAEGLIRPIYFFTLISHIGLSIVALPLVFTTFYFALSRKTEIHRKLARWTYPLWLYVSVTGVLIVLLLKIFNPA